MNNEQWRRAKPDELDREGPDPLYLQVADILTDRIKRGKLRIGDQVPGETELLRTYRISRGTARQVHRELRTRGLAYTVPAMGTFVGRRDVTPSPYSMPAYAVIAQDLATQIRAGVYPPDKAIPTRGALSKQYEVSVHTVRHAMKILQEAGWVFYRHPRGTFVASPDQWPDPGVWRKKIAVACGAD
ncbi:GntR family transcriptional regulator [Acrocarpospora sp. B8E8]|uniref:GntR family transcriptional regulator n=1 Tax=Acrocarpospora sp. B8E8 TaxID=3153572 RepID=UPI00325EA989